MATIEEICEVLKAHADGKTVQWKVWSKDGWEDLDKTQLRETPVAILLENEFRIKPQPREVWIVYPDYPSELEVFTNYNDAIYWCSEFTATIRKFREVVDDES